MKNIQKTTLWTALVTPFLSDGRVDYTSLEKLLREQESSGNGILILGSTGEALNISETERKEILDFTCEQKLSVPLMAGVGGIQLEETLRWVQHLNSLPLDAYLTVTPLYAKPGAKGQTHWFAQILDASEKPCVLYNVPGRAAVSLSLEAVKTLLPHKNFYGIKEASGSPDHFTEYFLAAPQKALYCGDDALMPEFARRGSCGLISVASNVWPKETKLYVEKALSQALRPMEEALWADASASLFESSNPVPVKRLLEKLGKISFGKLRPPLCAEDLESTEKQEAANHNVHSWFKDFARKGD